MATLRSRAWCFTLNNWTEEEGTTIMTSTHKYIIVGKEEGDSGTPHLQGYVYFAQAKTMSATKKQLGVTRLHLEAAKGNVLQNVAYCSKDGDFLEQGERPLTSEEKGRKEKRRYEDAWDNAKEGKLEDIDADIRVRHYSTLKKIKMDTIIERPLEDTEVKHDWYYGDTGTGKSRKARTDWPDAYLKMCNKWWDGYSDHDTVIIEDFDIKHSVLIHHLKIWGDRYPFPAEIKGGTFKIRPKRIIVTSNYHPEEIWSTASDLGPILRRFSVTHFQNGTSTL